jgi:hypothetical protein
MKGFCTLSKGDKFVEIIQKDFSVFFLRHRGTVLHLLAYEKVHVPFHGLVQ